MKDVHLAMRLTSIMIVSALLAVFVGYHIDQWLNTTPLCILLCMAYAIGGSLYLLIKAFGEKDD